LKIALTELFSARYMLQKEQMSRTRMSCTFRASANVSRDVSFRQKLSETDGTRRQWNEFRICRS